MREEYALYLDESKTHSSGNFTIAGFAVKKDKIPQLQDELEDAKKIIWTKEYIADNNPILHCTELQRVYAKRKWETVSGVKSEYNVLLQKQPEELEEIYTRIYGRLSKILKDCDATVFSCIIKLKQLHELFCLDETHDGLHLIDDVYNIALQNVIESYTHYLAVCDGYGDVVYEARNQEGENSSKAPDFKLVNDYHQIQANNKGIVYTDSLAVQNRNRTIRIHNKTENIAGLQIADFIAYNILKLEACNSNSQKTDFMKQIHRLSYNGGRKLEDKDQRSFWGFRVMPSYLKMEQLAQSNKTLATSYDNLKKEKKRLIKENRKKDDIIVELEEKIKQLENKDVYEDKKQVDTDTKI
jgi:hypothetical protein